MSDSNVIETFSKIFAVYNLILIVASFILNPIVLYTCIKSKKLRSISTFKILAFSSVNGMLTMIGWNQESFTNAFFSLYPYSRSLWYCRIITIFLQFSTLEYQSWMLVSISLDRLLLLTVRHWSKFYFNGFKPIIYLSFLALFIAAINSNQLFYGGNAIDVNGTIVIVCSQSQPDQSIDWYTITSQIFVYFGYIAPLSLLIVINILIIVIATCSNTQQRLNLQSNDRKRARMTKTILIITFLFVVVSIPPIIINGFFFGVIITLDSGVLILNLLNAIQFSYPALNFFILYFSNKQFAGEFKRFLPNSNRVSSTF